MGWLTPGLHLLPPGCPNVPHTQQVPSLPHNRAIFSRCGTRSPHGPPALASGSRRLLRPRTPAPFSVSLREAASRGEKQFWQRVSLSGGFASGEAISVLQQPPGQREARGTPVPFNLGVAGPGAACPSKGPEVGTLSYRVGSMLARGRGAPSPQRRGSSWPFLRPRGRPAHAQGRVGTREIRGAHRAVRPGASPRRWNSGPASAFVSRGTFTDGGLGAAPGTQTSRSPPRGPRCLLRPGTRRVLSPQWPTAPEHGGAVRRGGAPVPSPRSSFPALGVRGCVGRSSSPDLPCRRDDRSRPGTPPSPGE